MANKACRVHYTSGREQQASELGRKLGRGVVVPNAVESSQLDHSRSKDLLKNAVPVVAGARYTLFLGRLVPKKKLELLIRSFSRLPPSKSQKLVIAGTGEPAYIEKLKRLVAETQSADRIVFLGWVEGELKTALLQECALFVLVSDNENYGISVAEAMAAGRAVVVNKNVYLCKQIGEATAGWVIENDTELDGVLESALKNYAECERRGERGRSLVRNQFCWDRVVRQLEQVYQTCIASV